MKRMLTIDEQIAHMKSKGITFNIMSEEDAKEFLTHNNYYMKLASYRANYQKHQEGKNVGRYINLDFAYLKELSTIDMHLRYQLFEMCLDIEHALKVRLIEKITNNPAEDGYEAVRKFLAQDKDFRILKEINSRKSGEYCKELIEKYYPCFPAWVFVELISFGSLLYFISFYEKLYGETIINNSLMNTIRDLRNACAHSNCLLNHLSQEIDSTKQANSAITQFVKGMNGICATARRNNLRGLFAYNMVTLLYVYDSIMPAVAKQHRYDKLQEFMKHRVSRNKSYFSTNSKIVSVYRFFEKVIDNLREKAYNSGTIEK